MLTLGPVPDRLERPGRTLHRPECAGDQAVALVQRRDAIELGSIEFELGGRQVLAKSCGRDRFRDGRDSPVKVPRDQHLRGRTIVRLSNRSDNGVVEQHGRVGRFDERGSIA